jgi:hypothetical protein
MARLMVIHHPMEATILLTELTLPLRRILMVLMALAGAGVEVLEEALDFGDTLRRGPMLA